jgi:hypothetical protein
VEGIVSLCGGLGLCFNSMGTTCRASGNAVLPLFSQPQGGPSLLWFRFGSTLTMGTHGESQGGG